jgi:hypothetical protein
MRLILSSNVALLANSHVHHCKTQAAAGIKYILLSSQQVARSVREIPGAPAVAANSVKL